MKNHILIDSSFLIALYNRRDHNYHSAAQFAVHYSGNYVLAEVALVEVTYMLERLSGRNSVEEFFQDLLVNQPKLAHLDYDDYKNVHIIRQQYPQFDFVDACIMALSERLEIQAICTFDRRDFSQYRPSHWDFLELLPA